MSDFTPEQLKVVACENGNLVVTASAGSGKTSVMTERYINLILGGKAGTDDILCVTFTKLAAEELKTRIGKALRKAMLACTDNGEIKRLTEDINKLPSAAVSTVHAFCNRLIKKYFYVADVDPQFDIIDDGTAESLKKSTLDDLFDDMYESGDEDLLRLLKIFVKYRKDDNLKETILEAYAFLSSELDADKYMRECVAAYSPEGAENAVNGLIDLYIKKIDAFLPALKTLLDFGKEAGAEEFESYLSDYVAAVEGFENTKSFEVFDEFFEKHKVRPRKSKKRPELDDLADAVGKVNDKIKDIIKTCKDYISQDGIEQKAAATGEIIASFARVLKAFDSNYTAAKKEAVKLDYADLEKYAYKILCVDEVCAEIRKEYKYVFVDEYQDTNAVQEAIFSKLTTDNLFVVGDEKQSIYGFRGCDSSIFERRVREATEQERVSLDKNFRSARAVIDCVNNIFSALMTKDTTGTEYALHPMEYGGLYDKTQGRACIVCCGKEKKEKGELPEGVYSIKNHLAILDNASVDKEAIAVRKIIDKVYGEEYVVTDRDGAEVRKKVGYGDIAVLTRTGYGVDSVAKELISCGIPVVSDSKRSIGEYPEIKMIVALLKAVNYSGKEDFSLATALKSPVCGLDESKLLEIRSAYKTGTFYSAVTEYRLGRIDDISIKLNEFFDYIGTLKLLSRFCPVADIIKKIVKDKKIDTYFLTERLGEIKLKRLERFIIAAESFGSGLSLAAFVENETSVLKKLTIAFADGDNAVKVMDMHKSKGLEFPVTIVCELHKNMFYHDERDEITYSRKFGIGMKYYDSSTGTVYPNVVKRYVDENKKRNSLTEEIRLFYVAVTRAKYFLYIVTTTEPVSARFGYETETARKISDLLCKSDCEYVDISGDEDIDKGEEAARPVVIPDEPNETDVAAIKKYTGFIYPYEDDVLLSVKRTVTEITKTSAQITGDDDTPYAPPIFASASVESGNAYHKFLQLCSLDVERVESDLSELKASGALNEEECALLDVGQLKKILACAVFKELSGYKLYREQPFMAYVPAALAGERGSAEVLVQGVIDLLAVSGDGAVIVDYKYSGRSGEQLAAAYEKQLQLYAFAVEKVLKLKVESKILLNIKTCEQTQLKQV